MNIFIDTCALFKLYHNEPDAAEIESIFSQHNISGLFLSEITKIEFASTVWKKARMKDITVEQAIELMQLFESDCLKYTFVQVDNFVIEESKNLISKYGKDGLRTLDSIQLATSVMLKKHIGLFVTTDKLLNKFFKSEGLSNFASRKK